MITRYEQAQKTMLEKHFDGDVERFNEWKKNRSSLGGKASTSRPFRDRKNLAKEAGKKGLEKRYEKKPNM